MVCWCNMVTGAATDDTTVISGAVKLKENRRTIDTVASSNCSTIVLPRAGDCLLKRRHCTLWSLRILVCLHSGQTYNSIYREDRTGQGNSHLTLISL